MKVNKQQQFYEVIIYNKMQQLQFSSISHHQNDSFEKFPSTQFERKVKTSRTSCILKTKRKSYISELSQDSNTKRRHSVQLKKYYSKLGLDNIISCLDSMARKRKNYTIQLLKQFILFSTSEESILSSYKHMRHEMELAMANLENSYGVPYKVTLGKAFEMIKQYSAKRAVYHNQEILSKFTKNLNDSIKKLASGNMKYFFQQVNVMMNGGLKLSLKKEKQNYKIILESPINNNTNDSEGPSKNQSCIIDPIYHENCQAVEKCQSVDYIPTHKKIQRKRKVSEYKNQKNIHLSQFKFQSKDYCTQTSRKPNFKAFHNQKNSEILEENYSSIKGKYSGAYRISESAQKSININLNIFMKDYQQEKKEKHSKKNSELYFEKKNTMSLRKSQMVQNIPSKMIQIPSHHNNCVSCEYCSFVLQMKSFRESLILKNIGQFKNI